MSVPHPLQTFTGAAGDSEQTIPTRGTSLSCSAPQCASAAPGSLRNHSPLLTRHQVFGINAKWGMRQVSQANRSYYEKHTHWGSNTFPKWNGRKLDPSTVLCHLLPHSLPGGQVLPIASNHQGRICSSLCTTVTYSKNSFPNLIDWNPCYTVSKASSDMFQKMIRRWLCS